MTATNRLTADDYRSLATGRLFFARVARECGDIPAANEHERIANIHWQELADLLAT